MLLGLRAARTLAQCTPRLRPQALAATAVFASAINIGGGFRITARSEWQLGNASGRAPCTLGTPHSTAATGVRLHGLPSSAPHCAHTPHDAARLAAVLDMFRRPTDPEEHNYLWA